MSPSKSAASRIHFVGGMSVTPNIRITSPNPETHYSNILDLSSLRLSLPSLQFLHRLARKRKIPDLVERPFFICQPIHLKLDLRVGHLAVLWQRFEFDIVGSRRDLGRLRHELWS